MFTLAKEINEKNNQRAIDRKNKFKLDDEMNRLKTNIKYELDQDIKSTEEEKEVDDNLIVIDDSENYNPYDIKFYDGEEFTKEKELVDFSQVTTIVLDLDSTLVFTPNQEDMDEIKHLFNRVDIVQELKRTGYVQMLDDTNYTFLRPYVLEFLRFCHENFDNVIIWSAGTKPYVEMIVNILYRLLNVSSFRPTMILTQGSCRVYEKNIPDLRLLLDNMQLSLMQTREGNVSRDTDLILYLINREIERIQSGMLYKNIKDLQLYAEMKGIQVNLDQTFMIDDISENFRDNPRNGIVVKEFNLGIEDTRESFLDKLQNDRALLDIQNWLIQQASINGIRFMNYDMSKLYDYFPLYDL